MMQRRNDSWQAQWRLTNEPFKWDLQSSTIRFQREKDVVVASLCLVGTTSDSAGTFLWAWANPRIPAAATQDLELVRQFGVTNDLPLLTNAEFRGSRAEALEMLAIAGRILDGEGVFVAPTGDVTCFFVLKGFRMEAHETLADEEL